MKPTTTNSDRELTMSEQKVTRSLIVTDPAGVHVRTASAIQAISRRSQSDVTVISPYHKANGTDIWNLLALAALPGSTITLEVIGPDAIEVVNALEPVFSGDEEVLVAAIKKGKNAN
jgi:phosphotransferase system HPr (HPr) family protein